MRRLLQLITLLLIVPMTCLGIMVALSGGGMTPAFQDIGSLLMYLSPTLPLVAVGMNEWLWRKERFTLARVVLGIPYFLWAVLLIYLQVETGFFG